MALNHPELPSNTSFCPYEVKEGSLEQGSFVALERGLSKIRSPQPSEPSKKSSAAKAGYAPS